jgi:hypothetical protein
MWVRTLGDKTSSGQKTAAEVAAAPAIYADCAVPCCFGVLCCAMLCYSVQVKHFQEPEDQQAEAVAPAKEGTTAAAAATAAATVSAAAAAAAATAPAAVTTRPLEKPEDEKYTVGLIATAWAFSSAHRRFRQRGRLRKSIRDTACWDMLAHR